MENRYYTLIVITNESLLTGTVEHILNCLESLGDITVLTRYLKEIDEFTLIRHYQTHVIETVPQNQKSIIPTLGWPLVRNRFSRPLILALISSEDKDIVNKTLSLKGKTNPKSCTDDEARFEGFNITYNGLHSSDSISDSRREALLYFTEEEIKQFLTGEIGTSFNNFANGVKDLKNCMGRTFNNEGQLSSKVLNMIETLEINFYLRANERLDLNYIRDIILFESNSSYNPIKGYHIVKKYGLLCNEWESELFYSSLVLNSDWLEL